MKLELVKWKDELQAKKENFDEWNVEKEKIFKSGVFNFQKGDVISFNVVFSNAEKKPKEGEDRKLYIKQIIVRKKG